MARSSPTPTKADVHSMTEVPSAEAPRRIALRIKYAGGAFHGFQRQPGFRTVQEDLELAWAAVSGEQVVMHGSGRTDSGVHAWGQVVHFSTWSRMPAAKMRLAINAYLEHDLGVRDAAAVPVDFHARMSAVGKHYLYLCAVGDQRPVLQRGNVAWVRRELDLGAMREASRHFVGTHDFAAFAAAGRTTKTSVRTVHAVHIRPMRGGLAFHFRGGGFLYRQVRNMVGSLWEVGMKKHAPDWIYHVRESGDRKRAGITAPPEGLYLWRVLYPQDPFPPFRGSGGARTL